ncbi:lysine-specific demethylase hairless isoform X2 [Rhinatrema bivittatum]|uniref:lysine-specific demethylase hairless isoform X2 n=1 Tax=Rhinatrema bivittatum TaxID=194408 RepID=UPI00112790D8|nr:lysine-specific demethylase hairless isoform X2 [Rhinatrema bivittatum]
MDLDLDDEFTPLERKNDLKETPLVLAERILGAGDIGILSSDGLENPFMTGRGREGLKTVLTPSSHSTLPELPCPETSPTLRVGAGKAPPPVLRHNHEVLEHAEGTLKNLDSLHPLVIGRVREDCSMQAEAKVRDVPSLLSQKRRSILKETRPDFLELQSHFRTRCGEGKKKWAQKNREGLPCTWSEARPAPYDQAFYYPLPSCGNLQDLNVVNTGLTQGASKQEAPPASHSVLEMVRNHPPIHSLNPPRPFLLETKLFDRQSISVPSMPASSLTESIYARALAPFVPPHQQKCSSALEEVPFAKPNWHLPIWSHHNYQGPRHGGRIPMAHENYFISRKKGFPHRKETGLHLLVKTPTGLSPRLQPELLHGCPTMGNLKLLQDDQMEMILHPELKCDLNWKARGQNTDGRTLTPPNTATTNCNQINQPLSLVKQGTERPAGIWPASSLLGDASLHSSVAFGSDSEEENLNSIMMTNHSMEPGPPAAEEGPSLPQHSEKHKPTKTSAGELCVPPGVCQNPICDGSSRDCRRPHQNLTCSEYCSNGSHSSRMLIADSESQLGCANKVGSLSVLVCPPHHHTKLKNTWLSRHYNYHASCHGDGQTSSCRTDDLAPELKTLKRDTLESAEETKGFLQKQATKRTHGKELRAPQSAKRSFRLTHPGQHDDAPAQRAELKDVNMPRVKPESGDSSVQRGPQVSSEKPQEKQGATSLQSVPCSALPNDIERCCRCEAGSRGREDFPAEILCRFLHFRRLVLGHTGQLKVDGFPTLDEADSDSLKEMKPREGSQSPSPARYLLSTLGDSFCEIVRRDLELVLGTEGGGAIAWRRDRPSLHICDICRTGFFNTHWSCSRCGIQLCFQCYQLKKEQLGQDLREDEVPALRCVHGQQHRSCSLVPTQFISTNALANLWKTLHEVQAKFAIQARCSCGQDNLADTLLMGNKLTKEKEVQINPDAAFPAADSEEPSKCPATTEDSTESQQQSPVAGEPQGSVQASTLCDLLTHTAVKLCLGRSRVRMAFAPVSPSLHMDERISSILDNIIAQVVERKIQEKQWEEEGMRTPSPPESVSSYPPSPQGGVLWLHDPSLNSNYRRFQEHWRRSQPVLVSGLERTMKRSLWGPESLSREFGEQEAVARSNCCTPKKMNSKEFWDRFTGRSDAVDVENCRRNRLIWEYNLGKQKSSWTENLSSSLPLPEYCRNDGMLNLASYLPAEESRPWLGPRICAAYGEKADDRNIGTKPLTAQAADFLNILVYVETSPLCDRHSIQQEILQRVEADGMDGALKERLWESKSRPGALWHIFQAEDSKCIQSFLQKLNANQSQHNGPQPDPSCHAACYLDPSLRKRLREDFGVKSQALLQFLGDAVLIPAGCPYQVQCFSSTISVTQGFLSPENTAYSAHLMRTGRNATSSQSLYPQMERAIFGAVKNAMETLQRYI